MIFFYNGTILTQDKANPYVEAIAVEQDKIVAVGRWEEVKTLKQADSQVIDLQGQTLTAGLIDSHIHVWKVGNLLTYTLDVRGIGSISELQDRLSEYARQNPDAEWIQARGFNEAVMQEGRMPTRHDLDKVIADKPVYLLRTCAHIAVFNTKALEISGLTQNTPIPFGGIVDLDESGKPNGIVRETAMGLVTRHIPPYSVAQYEDMIHAAAKELLAHGVTSATDPGVMPDLLETYRNMDKKGALPMRFNVMAIRLPDGGNTPLPLPETHFSERLRIDTIKFFSDGGLSGKTAAISRPYRGFTDNGILRFDEKHLYDLAVEAHRNGLRIGIHAIGDRAIETVLNVYQRLYAETLSTQSHRIEHFGLPTDAHIETMARLGLSAVPQPIFLDEMGPNFRKYLDDGFLARCYPIRTLLDQGVKVAFSTDAPVVKNLNPFVGMQAALTRLDRTGVALSLDEAISAEEALYAYTMGSAIANGNEDEVGSIQVGKYADLVILDQNPIETPPHQIHKIKVKATYLNGKKVV
jgi:predicted amidohydrolase YtcJ